MGDGRSFKGLKTIGCRWVFHKKNNKQYKASLVAKGYAEKEGIDYNEIFFLIVKHTSIQVLYWRSQFDLELEHLNVKTVFLHSEIEEMIYMKHLKGTFRKIKK